MLAALKALLPGCVVAELKAEDAQQLGLASSAYSSVWMRLLAFGTSPVAQQVRRQEGMHRVPACA